LRSLGAARQKADDVAAPEYECEANHKFRLRKQSVKLGMTRDHTQPQHLVRHRGLAVALAKELERRIIQLQSYISVPFATAKPR